MNKLERKTDTHKEIHTDNKLIFFNDFSTKYYVLNYYECAI